MLGAYISFKFVYFVLELLVLRGRNRSLMRTQQWGPVSIVTLIVQLEGRLCKAVTVIIWCSAYLLLPVSLLLYTPRNSYFELSCWKNSPSSPIIWEILQVETDTIWRFAISNQQRTTNATQYFSLKELSIMLFLKVTFSPRKYRTIKNRLIPYLSGTESSLTVRNRRLHISKQQH